MTEALKKEIMDSFDKEFGENLFISEYKDLSKDYLKDFLSQAIDKSFRAGVEAVKLDKSEMFHYATGYNLAVQDLEALKKELLTNP